MLSWHKTSQYSQFVQLKKKRQKSSWPHILELVPSHIPLAPPCCSCLHIFLQLRKKTVLGTHVGLCPACLSVHSSVFCLLCSVFPARVTSIHFIESVSNYHRRAEAQTSVGVVGGNQMLAELNASSRLLQLPKFGAKVLGLQDLDLIWLICITWLSCAKILHL